VDCAAGCPARGLEFTLYRRDVAAVLPAAADFELNVAGLRLAHSSASFTDDGHHGRPEVADQWRY